MLAGLYVVINVSWIIALPYGVHCVLESRCTLDQYIAWWEQWWLSPEVEILTFKMKVNLKSTKSDLKHGDDPNASNDDDDSSTS